MLNVALDGADALDSRLAAYASGLGDALATKARALADALADKVKSDKLEGQVMNARSGALKDSIAAEVSGDGAEFVATVGSFGDVKYAAIQEYGGRTAAHEILPDKARALAFLIGGATHFARRVEHPGSAIPEHAYLRSSLDEMRDEIIAALALTADEIWEPT